MHLSPSFQRFRAAQAARAILGGEHPLARAEERMRWLRAQAAADAALVTASAAGLAAGATQLLALLVAAAAVQIAIIAGLFAAAGARRRRALELIAAGRAALPLAAVRRERARLARRVGALARSLERMRVDARRPMRNRPVVAPLYFPSVIREVDAELARRRDCSATACPTSPRSRVRRSCSAGSPRRCTDRTCSVCARSSPGCSTRSAPASPASLRRR